MLSILKCNLNQVTAKEVFIINKRSVSGEQLKLTISRRCDHSDSSEHYLGHCIAELRLSSEENLDRLDCSFLVHIYMVGDFTFEEDNSNLTDSRLSSTVITEMLPHVRACMASAMSSVGLAPYLIPNSILISETP